MRVKRGVAAHAKHKKILNAAKGMQHARTRSFRLGNQGVIKALRYSYRDRRNKKRDLRALWITRINNASRELGLSYSQLIAGMKAKTSTWIAKFSLISPSIIQRPSNKSLTL